MVHSDPSGAGADLAHVHPRRAVPTLSIGTAFSDGHRLMGEHYALLLGVVATFLAINVVVGLIAAAIDVVMVGQNAMFQPAGMAVQVFVQTPLAVGGMVLAAMKYRDGSGGFDVLFIGFTRYVPVVLIGLITTIATWALMFAIGMSGYGLVASGSPVGVVLAILIGLVVLVAGVYLAVRFWFGTMICVDPAGPRPGAIESLATSWRMTSGLAMTLFCLGLVVSVIVAISFVLLLLPGLFYGMPMATCVAGVAYALLAHRAGLVPMSGYDECPFCAYPLDDATGSICPECGAHVPRNG